MSPIGRTRIPLLLLWFVVQVSLIYEHAASTPNYLYTYCPNTTLFPATDSGYRTNINALLSTLSGSPNRSSSPGFHYTNSTASASLNGLYLCRGDVEPSTCRECVAAASAELPNKCPLGIQAVIWYDECMVRYSNTSFFAQLDADFALLLSNTQSVTTNVPEFNEVLYTTLTGVAEEAASVKFATEQAKFADFHYVYALGQCTPDLSTSDCSQCLQKCMSSMPTRNNLGGRVLFFSCNLRYETYLFYHTTNTTGGKTSLPKVVIGSIIADAAAAGLVLLAAVICLVMRKRDKKQANADVAHSSASADFSASESLQYGFDTLQVATNNFSDENKIGQGGFGHVYKGTLPNGQQVAVKRLLRSSGQAAQEFKNEVTLVAKLQHRNLVRLLGFCVSEDDKLVVYEYIPNNSLDSFLFDPEKQHELDWSTRYKIISGIARGMLYLHEDSQLRIIHRDLKASNVLLDADMTPKISDFGMARIFGEDETRGNTNRVVGTYGYMSPEYAMHGQFSVKSDVYSFGVVVLEIISGKRNSNFYVSGYAEDLLSYAWKLWREGRPMEFVDATLRNSCSNSETMRCIHIGLLCVQDEIEQRPTMASIVLMLNSHSVSLSAPLRPSYFAHKKTNDNVLTIKSTSKSGAMSVNEHL